MRYRLLPVVLLLFCLEQSAYAQQKVSLVEKKVVLPTYPVAEPERNPVFFTNGAFQGASRHIYPLKLNDQYEHKQIEKPWNFVVLSNDYIELAIAPEIGGKLYYAIDKTNNYDFIYKNNVVKPSNIGMTGAWVSGGIEWCVLHHHRASTFLPLDYSTTENEDGSKTIWIAEHEPRHGMRWTIGVTAFPGKSYFKAEGRIFNASPFTHSFLNWANVAVHTNVNYQTIFPPSAQVVVYHSKTDFSTWPVSHELYNGSDFTKGVDISWWKNTRESNSFFVYDLQEDFMGGYDHGKNSGTVHVGDHNIVKGAKLWQWGSGPRGQATEARLTINDGPYAEIMVGSYSDNQPDYSWIKPYEVKTWEQYWYPVRGIEGFKYANLNGAVNLDKKGEQTVFLGYYSTQKVNKAKVVLKKGEQTVFEKRIDIAPGKPFAEAVKLSASFDLNELHTQLINTENNEVLVEYQPKTPEPVKELPPAWKGYTSPQELKTIEEVYLEGKRVEQFYDPRYNAMDWYLEALKRDPDDIRSNVAAGNYYLKNGDYTQARTYLSRAIKRQTNDYTRPSGGEALYLQGLTLKSLRLYKEAVDTLYRASWDYAYHAAANFQLAQISMLNQDFSKALKQIDESLSTNARNNRAIALKASVLRKLGHYAEAGEIMKNIRENDPLDFRIQNEYYLLAKETGEMAKAGDLLATLTRKMRDFDDNYLELAAGYLDDGLLSEAEDILLRYKGSNPLIHYYLGYIYYQQNEKGKTSTQFNTASAHAVDNIFPYRLGTIDMLQTALRINPADGKAWYYMGNILYEKQPELAIKSWEKAVELNPDLAVAYRNIGWGYYRYYKDIPAAISFYEKAMQHSQQDAIYYSELDALYELNNSPIEKRIRLFEGNHEVVKRRDDALIREIEVMNLSGKPEEALKNLEGVEFTYREGSSRVREIIIDAHLLMGKKELDNKNDKKALDYFLKARIPEEEAGSIRMGDRNIQVDYYTGLAYEALKDKTNARKYFTSAAKEQSGRINVMKYYQGLSSLKLGQNDKAKKVFEAMIETSNRGLQGTDQSETGIRFGNRDAENVRNSAYYLMRGLGNKGLKNIQQARDDLNNAVNLSHSNLWARTELEGI